MPRYLLVVASSCQMYSGTGTAIFDWIRHCQDSFEFSILIDASVKANLDVTAAFCKANNIPLHVSASQPLPGCPDTGVRSIPLHLQQHKYEFIECVSWANAATNLSVLTAKLPGSKLIFTPHSQPLWTLQGHERYFMVSHVFTRMLRSADAIFIDSPSERDLPEFSGADDNSIHFVPLGVDTAQFRNSEMHLPFQVTCVCDARETRKRVDLLLNAFALAHDHEPRLRLILAGKGSDTLIVPDSISPVVTRLGYVTREELIRLYQTSALLALISDYEAFGLPIAEALCCGTPVLLNNQPAMMELFGDLPGVHWTHNVNSAMTAAKMAMLASGTRTAKDISEAASARFAFGRTYGKKRDVVLSL